MKTIPNHNLKRIEYLSIFCRELRMNSGLTQKELSKQMNLHRNTLIRAEKGKNISLASLFELADSLDISLKELLSEID